MSHPNLWEFSMGKGWPTMKFRVFPIRFCSPPQVHGEPLSDGRVRTAPQNWMSIDAHWFLGTFFIPTWQFYGYCTIYNIYNYPRFFYTLGCAKTKCHEHFWFSVAGFGLGGISAFATRARKNQLVRGKKMAVGVDRCWSDARLNSSVFWISYRGTTLLTIIHRIGWWENLQESPIFDGKNHGFL